MPTKSKPKAHIRLPDRVVAALTGATTDALGDRDRAEAHRILTLRTVTPHPRVGLLYCVLAVRDATALRAILLRVEATVRAGTTPGDAHALQAAAQHVAEAISDAEETARPGPGSPIERVVRARALRDAS